MKTIIVLYLGTLAILSFVGAKTIAKIADDLLPAVAEVSYINGCVRVVPTKSKWCREQAKLEFRRNK
jgi:hypothetical protein